MFGLALIYPVVLAYCYNSGKDPEDVAFVLKPVIMLPILGIALCMVPVLAKILCMLWEIIRYRHP